MDVAVSKEIVEADLVASLAAIDKAEKAEEEVDKVAAALAEIEAKTSVVKTAEIIDELGDFQPGSALGDDEVPEDLLNDLETKLAREEIYTAQTSDTSINTATVTAPPAGSTKPPRTAKTPRAPSTPRAPRTDLSALDDAVFEITKGQPANKAAVIASKPLQVKIGEKFENLFLAIASGKLPSHYTVIAFNKLCETGTMTSADLVGAYRAAGLKDGTARSQAGQLMELFKVVGIAHRAGQALTLRADSVVAEKLTQIIAQSANTATNA